MIEHEFEPVPGLPQRLPPGEKMLWQGKPMVLALARRVFRIHWIALYFAGLIAWRTYLIIAAGKGWGVAFSHGSSLAMLGAGAVVLFIFLAWMMARATLYTITTRRVVMRVGAVFDVAINLPFKAIERADLVKYRNGTGDINLTLEGLGHVSYWMLWPHAKPWSLMRVRPAMRALPEPERVAQTLGEAFAAFAAETDHTAADRNEKKETVQTQTGLSGGQTANDDLAGAQPAT